MHDCCQNIRVVTRQNSKFLLLLLQSLFVLSQKTFVSLTNLNKISEFLHRRQSSSLAGLLCAHTHPLKSVHIQYCTNHQKKAYIHYKRPVLSIHIRAECTSYSDCFYTSTRYTNKRSSFGGRKSEKVKVNGFVVWYGKLGEKNNPTIDLTIDLDPMPLYILCEYICQIHVMGIMNIIRQQAIL